MTTLKLTLMALLTLATACGPGEPAESTSVKHDPRLVPYIETVVDWLKTESLWSDTLKLPETIEFKETNEFAGQCTHSRPKTIHVRTAYADRSELVLAIMYHELVHCLYEISTHDPIPGHLFSSVAAADIPQWDFERWTLEQNRLKLIITKGRLK